MDKTGGIKGPEAPQINLRVNFLCGDGLEWMQIVSAASGSGSFANTVSGSRFECPKCRRQVAVELIIGTRYERPLA